MKNRKIGMRTIKTAISICIGLLIYIIFKLLDSKILINGVSLYSRKTGFRFSDFYSPFFAGIAAAYSLYPSKKQSIAQAKNRVVASLLGGIAGIVLTITYGIIGKITKNDFFTWPNLGDTYKVYQYIVPYILITLFIIVVITVGNLINKKSAIFVGILTFISVTINPMGMIVNRYNQSYDFLGEAVFGFNRILSTVVGVTIALCVNFFKLPHKTKNKNLLFMVGIEGMLKDDDEAIKGYINYKLNNVVDESINVSLFTTRVPSTFMNILDTVKINHPVVCMSGAALYDTQKHKYLYLEEIPYDLSKEIDSFLDDMNINPFKNYVVDDLLYTYIKKFDNDGMKAFYNEKKNAMYSNMILGYDKDNHKLLHYMICVENSKIDEVLEKLNTASFKDKILIQVYDAFMKNMKGFKYLKIYSREVLKLNVMKKYCDENGLKVVGLTTSTMADHLLENSDIRLSCADSKVENTIHIDSYDELFKNISSLYYKKNI